MRNRAYVHICGTLDGEIRIKNTPEGYRYAVIEINVDKSAGSSKQNRISFYNKKLYRAYIWNNELIDNVLPTLKAGEEMVLCGDLDVIPSSTNRNTAKVIITVTAKNGLRVFCKRNYQELNNSPNIKQQPKEEIKIHEL